MGQGFSKEQTEFLYMTVDNTSNQISDLKCWLKSHDENQETDISHSSTTIVRGPIESTQTKNRTVNGTT